MPSRSCGNHDRLARKFRRQWPTPRLSAWIRPGASTARAGPGGAPAGAGSLRAGCPARCGERPGQVRTCRALPRGWRAGRSRGDDGGGPARDGQLAALASSAVWEPGVQRRRLAMSLRPNTRLIRSGRSRPAGPTAHLVISSGWRSPTRVCLPGVPVWPAHEPPRGSPAAGLCAHVPPGPLGRLRHCRLSLVLPPGLRRP